MIREQFNASFSQEKYENFLLDLNSIHPDAIDFRIAETPVFIDRKLGQEMIQTCESIIDFIIHPDYMGELSKDMEYLPGICHLENLKQNIWNLFSEILYIIFNIFKFYN